MLKLCSATYYPIGNPEFICDAMQQIVFSEIGITTVWDTEDPYTIEFYAPTEKELIIRQKIKTHLPNIIRIVGSNKQGIWSYLFENALYVAQHPRQTLTLAQAN